MFRIEINIKILTFNLSEFDFRPPIFGLSSFFYSSIDDPLNRIQKRGDDLASFFCALKFRNHVNRNQTCIFPFSIQMNPVFHALALSYLALKIELNKLDMTKSYALLSILIVSVFAAFGQTEDVVTYQIPTINRDYVVRGCCSPARINPSSCTAMDTNKLEKTDPILDITDPELSGLTASPNPTKGIINVVVPANFIGFEIQIIDMTGRFVGAPIPITDPSVQLNLECEAGIYLITIRTVKAIITERIFLDK